MAQKRRLAGQDFNKILNPHPAKAKANSLALAGEARLSPNSLEKSERPEKAVISSAPNTRT